MRDNTELKSIGKAAFKANYWSSVVASLVLYALLGVTADGSRPTVSAAGTAMQV